MPGTTKRKIRRHRFYDYELLVSVIFLCVFGLIMIYSASSYRAQIDYKGDSFHFVKMQGMVELAGLAVMLFVSRKVDYHFFARFAWVGYFLSYILLFLMRFTPLGVASHGKKRWLKLGIQFQPSEVIKIVLILLLAVLIGQIGMKVNDLSNVRRLIIYTAPLILAVTSTNLSSGIIIGGIVFMMLMVAVKKQWPFYLLLLLMLAVIVISPYICTYAMQIGLLKDYQMGRILVWKDPIKYARQGGYQVLQGLYAIGSGGLFGKGLGQSLQKLGFVPEAQNDMIFTIICEELGLFGAFCLIAMFLFMLYRLLVIAQNAPDLMGAMIVVGVMAHIAIQVVLNIAVVTNVIPNTGVTLPFISYGGTSVGLLLLEMGLALSVSNQITQDEENE